MPYDKKPSGGSGSDLWPVVGTNIKTFSNNMEVLDIGDGALLASLVLTPADYVKEIPTTVPPITHVTICLNGTTPGVNSTWVPVDDITQPCVDLMVASGLTACALTGVQILQCFVSTDGITPSTYYTNHFVVIADETNACGGP